MKEGIAAFFQIHFTPLEIMLRCSAAGLHFKTIPAGFNAPLEFLTGFTLPTGNYIIYEEFVKKSLPIGKLFFLSFFGGVDTA
jgi:hypothetical protein